MNVRTLSNPISPIDVVKAPDVRQVKLGESSPDRDANGRREQGEEQNQDALNEQEVAKSLEYFASLENFKEHGLTVKIEESNGRKLFVILDPEGKTIRRIPDWEMRPIISDKDKRTGQIFDKSA